MFSLSLSECMECHMLLISLFLQKPRNCTKTTTDLCYVTCLAIHPSLMELLSNLGNYYVGDGCFQRICGTGHKTPELREYFAMGKQIVVLEKRNQAQMVHIGFLLHAMKHLENSVVFVHPSSNDSLFVIS